MSAVGLTVCGTKLCPVRLTLRLFESALLSVRIRLKMCVSRCGVVDVRCGLVGLITRPMRRPLPLVRLKPMTGTLSLVDSVVSLLISVGSPEIGMIMLLPTPTGVMLCSVGDSVPCVD